MKLEHPLSGLIDRCQTICVPECCGRDAYHFSPIHIASYLILWRGDADDSEVMVLRDQIRAQRREYASAGELGVGVANDSMNQSMTGDDVDKLADLLLANLDAATEIVARYSGP